jgi:MFS family permease
METMTVAANAAPAPGEADRDAGFLQGLLLALVPTTIVIATCVALPILPAVVKAFPNQANIAELVPLIAVLPTLAVAFTALAAGLLGEKVGRRRLLIIGTGVFAISSLAPMVLNDFILILVSRGIMGLAIGVMITSAVALTADYFSGATLQRWLGAQGGAAAIAGVVVSFASGALGEVSWRYAFLPLAIGIPLFIGLLLVPAPKAHAPAAASVATEAPAGPAAIPWGVWLAVFAISVIGTAIIFPPAYEAGALVQEKALGSSFMTGAAVAVLAAGASGAAFSLGWLRMLSAQIKVAIAIAAAGIGTFLMAQSTALVPFMIGSAIVGIGQGMLGPVLSIWLLEGTAEKLRGRAVGIYQTVTFLTLFVAPLVARQLAVALHASSGAMRIYMIADGLMVLALSPTFFRRRQAIPAPVMTEPA